MAKTGVILLNLGTPRSPQPADVGAYLREFLMDPYVIDIPAPLRWFLVNVLIVPRRKHASGALYRKIWNEKGSPLLYHHLELAVKVQQRLGKSYLVAPAMRYVEPSVEEAVGMLKEAGVDRLICCPLYPQYSLAATESSVVHVEKLAKKVLPGVPLTFLPPFYAEPAYLDAVASVSAPYLQKPFDKVLFSFHGLPERQVKKTDPSGQHCLVSATCCDSIGVNNAMCYRAQSFVTAREVAKRLGLQQAQWDVGFQSRLGRTPWIRPYSDAFYRELPSQGVKHLTVLCPSFVADCLETLEEVQLRGLEEFRQHGGESLTLVPSLNSEDVWAEAVASLTRSV